MLGYHPTKRVSKWYSTFSCSLSWHKGMSHESESGYTRSRERASITSTAITYTLQSRMLDTVDREIMNVSKLLTPKGVMLDIHRDHVLGQTLHPIFAPSCTRTNGTYTWLDIYLKLLICLRFPFPLPGILSREWRRKKKYKCTSARSVLFGLQDLNKRWKQYGKDSPRFRKRLMSKWEVRYMRYSVCVSAKVWVRDTGRHKERRK